MHIENYRSDLNGFLVKGLLTKNAHLCHSPGNSNIIGLSMNSILACVLYPPSSIYPATLFTECQLSNSDNSQICQHMNYCNNCRVDIYVFLRCSITCKKKTPVIGYRAHNHTSPKKLADSPRLHKQHTCHYKE